VLGDAHGKRGNKTYDIEKAGPSRILEMFAKLGKIR